MSMSPKEFLKRIAEAQDSVMEALTRPFRDLAENMGLPTPPEPPRAADLVESLPELPLPTPESLLPFAAKKEEEAEVAGEVGKAEVAKIKTEEEVAGEEIRFKIA